MQLIDQLKKELQTRQVSVLKLSKETGIDSYKIYKWLDKKGNPKHDDSQKLEQWLSKGVDKVPTGNGSTNPITDEPPTPYEKAPADKEGLTKALIESQNARIKLLEERQQSESRLAQVEVTLKIVVEILNGLKLQEQPHIPSEVKESIGEVAVRAKKVVEGTGSKVAGKHDRSS